MTHAEHQRRYIAKLRKGQPWKKRGPMSERGADLYETPPIALEALLAVEALPHRLWEPACGPGALVGLLRDRGHEVLATDMVDRGCPDSSVLDFFAVAELPDVEAVITNPPYLVDNGGTFARHALTLGAVPIWLLLPSAVMHGSRRADLHRRLVKVLSFRNRLPRMHRDGWTGKRSTSNTDFGWFLFDARHDGSPPVLGWL